MRKIFMDGIRFFGGLLPDSKRETSLQRMFKIEYNRDFQNMVKMNHYPSDKDIIKFLGGIK